MEETTAKAMEVDDEPHAEAEDEERQASIPQEKNPSSGSDSDSDSESDSDEEAADESKIQTLESQLEENPWNYDAHLQYIHSLRKLGHIEKLRQARESMSKHFPLSPKMWQEWAKDEASLDARSEAFADIEKLFERGVHEFLSVPLWCDYLNNVQEHDQLVSQCAPAGVLKMRNLFERALTAAGLHVTEGSKIWETYREYEQAIFMTVDDDNNEEKAKQVHRIRALFHRQLSIPLVDLMSTLENYKLWEIEQGTSNDINSELDGIPANVASAYLKALEMYNARKAYEDQLSKSDASDADKLQSFLNYIKFEESSGDPARVQILYERAVSELPIYSELWLGYTSYLDKTLKVPSIIKDVYSRAVRSCSWLGDLWVNYMLSLERLGASENELSTVFERSIQCVFRSFEEYLNLFLTRVDGLRRRISSDGTKEDELTYMLIRETFQRAADYFSPEMIRTDDLLHLYDYWARLEGTLGHDLLAARGVWENLIKKSGSLLEAWRSYIGMEISLGHINEARSIYKRCYSKRFSGTGSQEICHSWLRFEREYGTIGDLDLAMKKVTPRLQELEMFKTQQESKSGSSLAVQENNLVATSAPQKRKMTKSTSDKKPPSKRRKDSAKSVEVSHVHTVKQSQSMHDEVEKTTLPNPVEPDVNNEQSSEDTKLKESKPKLYTDSCTAYVSNIVLEAKDENLREFFADPGGVTAIRLLRDKFTGKLRGIAYVDFIDDEHLAAAIAKNKQKMLGQKLSIVRSDPKQSQKRGSVAGSASRGRGRGAPFRSDRSGPPKKDGKLDGEVKLVGRNTFAAPRAVRALGYTNQDAKTDDNTEQPKSNDEFRSMFLKK